MARSVKIEAKQCRQASNRSLCATDIEEALVLAGKARGRQILGRRRTAHRDGNVGPILRFELSIGFGDLLSKASVPVASKTIVPRFGGAFGQDIDAGLVDVIEKLMQPLPRSGRRERIAVGLGG